SYWIHREVDAYFVACERSRRELALRHVPLEKIFVTGIPVNPDFAHREDTRQIRTRLGLDENRKTVLMMGGGLGLVAYDKLVRSILKTESNAQIVSIVGADGKRLDSLRSRLPSERVTVLGYVNNVHDWMNASDVIVSKPGGLTCAEVLARGLPFVMTSPLPGQEEVNVHYMLSSGAAVYAESPRQVAEWVNTLLNSENAKEYLTSKALAFGRPNAVRDIVTLAVQNVGGA
ncbi:MAG TPA: glycosyltransferase, partial [bacterium]|nr:glycosyltransferase [bacterium]